MVTAVYVSAGVFLVWYVPICFFFFFLVNFAFFVKERSENKMKAEHQSCDHITRE